MKHTNKITRLLIVVVLCAMLATTAFAAESGTVWLNVSAEDAQTCIAIVTDTTVTDGLIELSYNPNKLAYVDVTVNEKYVAMYSVNAEEDGVVKISWVAPNAYEADGTGISLIEVHFLGAESESTAEMSGEIHDAQGERIPVGEVDTTELEKAIKKAEGLNSKDYTDESFAAVKEALANAKAVLADKGATQKEVDAAAKALNDAMNALVLVTPDTGDNSNVGLMVGLMLASAAGIVALAAAGKRKRGNA